MWGCLRRPRLHGPERWVAASLEEHDRADGLGAAMGGRFIFLQAVIFRILGIIYIK